MRLDVKIAILRSEHRQYELAQAIGVSEYRLSKYVNGRAQLQPEQEAKLAALIGLQEPFADAVLVSGEVAR